MKSSQKKLPLFIFIDALGWEVLRRHPDFFAHRLPHRKPLETIFGYSSACDPSIISGKLPCQHGLWSSFYYSPNTSPFRLLRPLRHLPAFLKDSARVRGILSRWIKKLYGMTGYFQLYQLPFEHLHQFDYAEKKSIWGKEGILGQDTIFTHLHRLNVPHYVDGGEGSDQKKIADLKARIQQQDLQFAYLQLGGLDALMHQKGTSHPEVALWLKRTEEALEELICQAQSHYQEVPIHIFSDHGMHNVQGHYDLQAEMESSGLRYGEDFIATYDSTMARFWPLKEGVEREIREQLHSLAHVGRILTEEELKRWGVHFKDGRYGRLIFLMHSATVIAPSHMGKKPVAGMHGFHPEDPDSKAAILSNKELPERVARIEQIFELMMNELV